MPEFIDLSHTIVEGLITFKGLPGPIICDFLSRGASRDSYTEGTEFQIGRIDMVANTGTYIDCPFHRYADGKDLNETELKRFVDLPGVMVHVNHHDRLVIEHDANDDSSSGFTRDIKKFGGWFLLE